jgi:hypothetical protein
MTTDRDEAVNEPFDLERAPLDKPPPFDTDWGGDGSDLTRPVRAHVLAALRPPAEPYAPPVSGLLTLGDGRDEAKDEQRRALGIGQEHVAELARMARDRGLYTSDGDSAEVWAPFHALKMLAELDPAPVVAELVPLIDLDDDYFPLLLEEIFAKAGAVAVDPLRAYLEDRGRWGWGQLMAASGLEKVAMAHPELRPQVIEALNAVLEAAEQRAELDVTGAVSSLTELKATESLPLIRRAFELGSVDESIQGDWGEIQEQMGVSPDPHDPLVDESRRRRKARHAAMFAAHPRADLEHGGVSQRTQPASTQRRRTEQARKQKNKRKAAAASRKANRKKKK